MNLFPDGLTTDISLRMPNTISGNIITKGTVIICKDHRTSSRHNKGFNYPEEVGRLVKVTKIITPTRVGGTSHESLVVLSRVSQPEPSPQETGKVVTDKRGLTTSTNWRPDHPTHLLCNNKSMQKEQTEWTRLTWSVVLSEGTR